MAKTRTQKEEIVKLYSEKLQQAKSLVFVHYKGLKVKDTVSFRKKTRDAGAEYVIAKKSLMNIAFEKSGLSADSKILEGDIGTVFGYEDEIVAPKLTYEFMKTNEALKPLGGMLGGIFIDEQKVSELARFSSKKELLATVVRTVQAPVSGFVNVLAATIRGLVQVMKAIQEKKA